MTIPHSGPARPDGLPVLSSEEMRRYGRQTLVAQIGIEGQLRLKKARVLVVGLGGLGSPVSLYLAAAGVGTLGLVDADEIELSNLHRQVLFDVAQVGQSKVHAASARLRALNPHVSIEGHSERFAPENAERIASNYDLVVDATDNFATRYLINDTAVLLGKPNVSAAIFAFDGQLSVFLPGGPCYRCLFPARPPASLAPSCNDAGVVDALAGVLGTLQAMEAIKILLGIGESLEGRLLTLDALSMQFETLRFSRRHGCAACGNEADGLRALIEQPREARFCGPVSPGAADSDLEPEQVLQAMSGSNPCTLLDVRSPEEMELARLPSARCIPLAHLTERIGELDRTAFIVCFCHKGGRSSTAASLMRAIGFSNVHNMRGGIDAWSRRVDPDVPLY